MRIGFRKFVPGPVAGFLAAGLLVIALLVISLLVAAAVVPSAAQESDRHAGYYYPPPTVTETYESLVTELADANRTRRIGFVTILVNKGIQASYPPPFSMFVKGAEGEKLIIVGMGGYIGNIYQARGLLALLTAQARTTEMFVTVDAENRLTFLDLLKMLGFAQVTVTDGKSYTLQIAIK